MKITDYVKPSMMNRSHIEAAEKMLAPRESVLYSCTANCRTAHGVSNRIIVLTGHRLLFVTGIVNPPQCDAFSLSSCIGIGDITGGLIPKQDYVCDDQRITVEASKDRLQALTEKTLVAIEAYPNQPTISFPAGEPVQKTPAAQTRGAELTPSRTIKICTQCGDRLLAGARKCPSCGSKELAEVDCDDVEKINALKARAGKRPVKSSLAPTSSSTSAKKRIAENKASGVACCPKCGSTSLSANKKGFSFGKAATGAFIAGPVGLVGGTLGANKLEVTCLNCGHKFRPGKK